MKKLSLIFLALLAFGPMAWAQTIDVSDASELTSNITNGNIIVNGEGVLQVVDVMGHIIMSTNFARNVSTSGMTPGVYVLRLINGNDIKTQKIIIQ